MAKGAVAVSGLRELVRAFDKMNRDLTNDLGDELTEAAQPARLAAEEDIAQMRGVVGSGAYVSQLRVGFSRPTTAYVAPLWRSNKGTPQGRVLAAAMRRRMERAVQEKQGEIEQKLSHFIDTLADDWGRGI